jgi:hypothetical protein
MRVGQRKGLAIDNLTSNDLLLNMRRNQNHKIPQRKAPLKYHQNFFFTAMRGHDKLSEQGYVNLNRYEPHFQNNLAPLLGELRRVMDDGNYTLVVNDLSSQALIQDWWWIERQVSRRSLGGGKEE